MKHAAKHTAQNLTPGSRMPATAVMAHRQWISSACAYLRDKHVLKVVQQAAGQCAVLQRLTT